MLCAPHNASLPAAASRFAAVRVSNPCQALLPVITSRPPMRSNPQQADHLTPLACLFPLLTPLAVPLLQLPPNRNNAITPQLPWLAPSLCCRPDLSPSQLPGLPSELPPASPHGKHLMQKRLPCHFVRPNSILLEGAHLGDEGPHHEAVEHLQVAARLPSFQVAHMPPKAAQHGMSQQLHLEWVLAQPHQVIPWLQFP